jgi:hypothetical protein
MTANLAPGTYRVISLTDGNPPLGINLTKPGIQFILVNGPVQQWVIRKSDDDKLLLSIGGYPYTGVIDNKVAASINFVDEMAWEITYREVQEAYTLARVDDPSVGWTVTGTQVAIQTIKETASIPPQYATSQLFRLEQYQ